MLFFIHVWGEMDLLILLVNPLLDPSNLGLTQQAQIQRMLSNPNHWRETTLLRELTYLIQPDPFEKICFFLFPEVGYVSFLGVYSPRKTENHAETKK